MNEERHLFTLHGVWNGNSDGDGMLTAPRGTNLPFGVPEAFGGKPGRTNPEELLLGAVIACYSITLSILAEKRRLPLERIVVDAEGEVIRQPNRVLKFSAIRLHTKLFLVNADEAQQQTAIECAHKAEEYCMISCALRGNVAISVEPEIVNA
ncbi:predicted redox protein, regulator of disulfide bond formation [Chthonomonas calidirosea]|uniref:Predicted redox protein, regulator of disulfide bond formation n=1 Tax=Chthonomonas calidirosea (strain DSM 23976 / ICMP 18418 / T49) TaxID=1303518 RepID=S0EWN8_CHTCT|nr:OsmC family protein [Chthonomonas calidirosea]CCW34148.1 Predicted redox protein, regulator of disulfide bond formation [Chthonomonas calidirosea T49]CEK14462.1 predicted redox protein, regulator of disulfide bond formation [Chthonomonas calidirosea]CEK14463.1 predicted redox protein, regulator of disulfide bond formation [Chthonomonas calidirosea]CEK15621.1 predicted redox protein, regulator of disulfide bond formation [Chthonomonas calidirosea]